MRSNIYPFALPARRAVARKATILVMALVAALWLTAPASGSSAGDNSKLAREMAVVKLYGAVRYFYPAEAVEDANWDVLLHQALNAADEPGDSEAFARSLVRQLEPIAPDLRLDQGESSSTQLECKDNAAPIRWIHRGFAAPPSYMREGLHDVYSSSRATWPRAQLLPSESDLDLAHRVPLPGGWSAVFPLSLCPEDADRSAPEEFTTEQPDDPAPDDLAAQARLAVATLWPILRHFYPYPEVLEKDWDTLLAQGLGDAAQVERRDDLQAVLEHLTAPLADAHVHVRDLEDETSKALLPFDFIWEDGVAVVVAAGDNAPLAPGDRIVAVDGEAIEQWRSRIEARISGGDHLKALKAQRRLLHGQADSEVTLSVVPADAASGKAVDRVLRRDRRAPVRALERPAFRTLDDGVVYVNLSRAKRPEIEERLDELVQADGIVLDLRGYTARNQFILSHLLDEHDRWGDWMQVLIATGPGGQLVTESRRGWYIPALPPKIDAPAVLLVNAAAISAAESFTGMVKRYGLATVVGEPTAGSNGNIRWLDLPGNFRVTYTGMRVFDPAGEIYQGRGLQPDVVARPTAAGLIEGRDEVLEKGLEVLTERRRDSS